MSIDAATFNQAVAEAVQAVKPKLITVEAEINALGLAADHPLKTAIADLHAELANQLRIADELGGTGGAHALSGGSDKGDGA